MTQLSKMRSCPHARHHDSCSRIHTPAAGRNPSDARWRLALGDVQEFHPTTLVNFRKRLAENGKARLALDACLEAMRDAGYRHPSDAPQ